MASLNERENNAWRSFLHASTRLLARLDNDLKTVHGERLTDFDVLSNLSEAPDQTLRMSDLADQTLFSRSRLTYTVGNLEKRGLVVRTPDPHDRRGIVATLTGKGRALHRKLAATHVQGIRDHFIGMIPPADQNLLTHILSPVADDLEAHRTD